MFDVLRELSGCISEGWGIVFIPNAILFLFVVELVCVNMTFLLSWKLLLAVTGFPIGFCLHEYTHKLVYQISGGDPHFKDGWCLSGKVNFKKEMITNKQLSIGSGINLIYLVIHVPLLIWSPYPTPVYYMFVIFLAWGASVISPPDWLGTLFPNLFREYDKAGIYSHGEAFRYLKRGFGELLGNR